MAFLKTCPACGVDTVDGAGTKFVGIIERDRVSHWTCPKGCVLARSAVFEGGEYESQAGSFRDSNIEVVR